MTISETIPGNSLVSSCKLLMELDSDPIEMTWLVNPALASPVHSSPLSNPPVHNGSPTSSSTRHIRSCPASAYPGPVVTPRRASTHLPRSSLSPMTSTSNTSTIDITPTHTSTTSPSPPLSRSHPLLGSYPLSLIHSRMSHAHAPHSVPSNSTSGFALHLGALGKGKSCLPELRCPQHLVVPFAATYYDLEDPSGHTGQRTGAAQTPWVGTVDLEKHYFDSYSSALSLDDPSPPSYPGYRVAPLGQLQILIKTPTQAIKVFLVPYDLRTLPIRGRLLARERTYVQSPAGNGRESLRYAFQLQFTCLPAAESLTRPIRDSSTTRRRKGGMGSDSSTSSRCPTPTISYRQPRPGKSDLGGKAFYVSKSVKVVFTSSVSEGDEVIRTERTDEVVLPSEETEGTRGRVVGFSPGSMGRRADDWELVRRKWSARKEVEQAQLALPSSFPYTSAGVWRSANSVK